MTNILTRRLKDANDSKLKQNSPILASDISLSLSDIGASTELPFVILNTGQSNSLGSDNLGSKVVEANIWTTDNQSNPTKLIPAQFGVAPFNIGNSGTTTDPVQAWNNPGIHLANNLRRSGLIPDARRIIVVSNSYGAQAISQWVGNGTSSTLWQYLVANLAVVDAAHPGFKINIATRWQGEADSGGTGANTYALYDAALTTFIAQLKSLPQWTPNTLMVMQELGTWKANTGQARNDVIRTYANGNRDSQITVSSSTGLTDSLQQPGPHADGNSLVEVGRRWFSAWKRGKLAGGYHDSNLKYYGSAFAFPNALSCTTGQTLTLDPDDIDTGANITATGGTIILPNAAYLTGTTIILNVSGSVTLQAPNGGMITENAGALATSTSLSGNAYRLTIAAGTWRVETWGTRIGGWQWFAPTLTSGAAVPLSSASVRGTLNRCNGNTITLPAASVGGEIAFFGDPAGTSTAINTVDGSSTLIKSMGVLAASITVAPKQLITLVASAGYWIVATDTFKLNA